MTRHMICPSRTKREILIKMNHCPRLPDFSKQSREQQIRGARVDYSKVDKHRLFDRYRPCHLHSGRHWFIGDKPNTRGLKPWLQGKNHSASGLCLSRGPHYCGVFSQPALAYLWRRQSAERKSTLKAAPAKELKP